MPIRRLKLLGRERIKRSDIEILVDSEDSTKRFTARFDLQSYDFKEDARIYIDAKQLMETIRFDYGTVAHPRGLGPCDVSSLKGDNIQFHLFVVDPNTAHILGEARGLRHKNAADPDAHVVPLLPVDGTQSLGGLLWRIDYCNTDAAGSSDAPVLLIDRDACGESAATFIDMPAMAASILPAAMQSILFEVAIVRRHSHDPASERWADAWIRCAVKYSGMNYVEIEEGQDDLEPVTDWIKDASCSFSRKCGLVDLLVKHGVPS